MPEIATAIVAVGEWFAALGPLEQALIKIGGSLLLSAASKALMGHPDTGLQGRTVTVRQPVVPRDIVVGFSRKGGVITYIDSRGGTDELDLVITLSGNRVHSIGNIYFNGELAIPAGSNSGIGRFAGGWATMDYRLGDANQTAYPYLMSVSGGKWTANHRQRGCASIYLHLVANADVFPTGIPNITVDIEGSDEVYDPRIGMTAYTRNPALILAWYMANPVWGLGAGIGDDDGIDTASLIAAANICWETVPKVGGGVEPRYACDGVIGLAQSPKTNIEALLTSFAGTCGWQAGAWHLYAGAYRIPTVSFSDDDVVDGGLQLATRVSMADNFNAVRGQFVSPENDWQPDDFPAYESAVYLAEDSGVRKYRDISLPFTISASMAQRLAKIELERVRRQFTLTFAGKLSAWRATVGDTIEMSYARFGFSAKPFEVKGMSLALVSDENGPRLQPQLSLRETSPLVYDWTTSEAKIYAAAPRTTLPNAFSVAPPGGLSVTEELYQTLAGSGVKALARISWTAALSGYVAQYQIEGRIGVGPWQVLGRTDQLTFDILDIAPAIWEFRVKAISQVGVSSAFVSVIQQIYGLSAPPVGLTNVTLQTAGGAAILKWALHPDLDVRIGGNIVIRHSTASAPSWGNSVSMDIVAGIQAIAVVPLKPGAYLLRAEDASGVPGPETVISTNGAQALAFANLTTLTEDTAFTGAKSGVTASGGALVLDSSASIDSWANFDAIVNFDAEGGILPSGTYSFAAGMDFGSVKLARLRSVIDLDIVDLFSTVDDRVGNIDTWASFDGSAGGEVDVVVEVRTTTDNPSGSPTWGPWGRVDSTEVQARGVEARAILTSADATFTPSVTQLRLIAEEVV